MGRAVNPDGLFGQHPELCVMEPGGPCRKDHAHPKRIKIIRNRWVVVLFLSQGAQQNMLNQVESFAGDIELDQKAAQQVYRLYRLFLVFV